MCAPFDLTNSGGDAELGLCDSVSVRCLKQDTVKHTGWHSNSKYPRSRRSFLKHTSKANQCYLFIYLFICGLVFVHSSEATYLLTGYKNTVTNCKLPMCTDAARHGWTEWSSYGDCSKTCGVGTQQKSRTCKAGSESPCSALCTGGYTASRTCTVGGQ